MPDVQADQMSDRSSNSLEQVHEDEVVEEQEDAAVEHEVENQDQENGQVIVPEAEGPEAEVVNQPEEQD